MKHNLSIKTNQQLVMNLAMQKALHVLQMPIAELSTWLENQIVENPILELQTPSQPFDVYEYEIPDTLSLEEFLQRELSASSLSPLEAHISKIVIAFLDKNGFVSTSFEHIARTANVSINQVIKMAHLISQLDPPGLATIDLQHSLLAQLEAKGKTSSLAYTIIHEHWTCLASLQYSVIAKALNMTTTELLRIIKTDIQSLNPCPAQSFHQQLPQCIIPDLVILDIDATLTLSEKSDLLPKYIMHHYDVESAEDRMFVRQWLSAAKWVDRIVARRTRTLLRIGEFLMQTNQDYFLSIQPYPTALKIVTLADELNLNISTISRALKDKYIETPRGIFPLNYFVSSTQLGNMVHKSQVHTELMHIIASEDKKQPYSDEMLTRLLAERGLSISRRTVTKYRQELSIPKQQIRKNS